MYFPYIFEYEMCLILHKQCMMSAFIKTHIVSDIYLSPVKGIIIFAWVENTMKDTRSLGLEREKNT